MLGQVFTVFGNETRCVSCFQIGRGLAIVCGFLFEGQPPIKLMHVSSCRSLWFCVEYLDMYQNSLGRCSMVLIFEISRTNFFLYSLMPVLKVKVAVVCVLWFEGDRQSYTFHYRSACSMAAYVCINRDRHVDLLGSTYL